MEVGLRVGVRRLVGEPWKVGRVEAREIPDDPGGVVKVRPGWKPARWRRAD